MTAKPSTTNETTTNETTTNETRLPQPGRYRIDTAHSAIRFRTRHMFGLAPVRGSMRIGEGDIRVTDPVHDSTVQARIPVAGFDTGNAVRDRTVRSRQYLDAERHPDIVFHADGVSGEDGRLLHGSLTVCGVSAEVPLRIEHCAREDGRLCVSATGVVDRYAFGITAMRGMAGRKLTVQVELACDVDREPGNSRWAATR